MRGAFDLADGRRIEVRQIGPEDRDALARGFERLGAESRYLRFFGPLDRLSDGQLTYLTDVDHHDHEALVAVDEETGEGVGVARFVRIAEGVAEPAVAVADDWQRHGIGTRLLDELSDRAREEGIHEFLASVLADNVAAIAVLGHLGQTHIVNHGRELELRIALEDERGAVASLRRLLRHTADLSIRPSTSIWGRAAEGDPPAH